MRSHKSVAGFIEGGRIGVIAVSEREEHADDERPGMDAYQVSELRRLSSDLCSKSLAIRWFTNSYAREMPMWACQLMLSWP